MLQGDLFAGLTAADLEKLEQASTRVKVARGTRIFNLGEEATSLLLIIDGVVGLTLPIVVHGESHEVTLDEKSAGSFIAWSALVPPHKLTLSAVAGADVTLARFDGADMRRLMEDDVDLRCRILANLAHLIGSRVATLEALLIRNIQRQVSDRSE